MTLAERIGEPGAR